MRWVLALLVGFAMIESLGAATVTFSESSFPISAEAIADGAPACGTTYDLFVTTDADILSIDQVLVSSHGAELFQVPPPFGSDTAASHPEFIALRPAAEFDSWITTPGMTIVLGPGLDATDGTSTFGDLSDDGPQDDFHFARLTFSQGGSFDFRGRVIVGGANGPEAFPFSISGFGSSQPAFPFPGDGSTINLTHAYRNNGGEAPGAIFFGGSCTCGCFSIDILSATIENPSLPNLFGVTHDQHLINLTVDPVVARTVPATTLATAQLVVETTAGFFNYSLTATVPEPTNGLLAAIAMIGWVGGARRSLPMRSHSR